MRLALGLAAAFNVVVFLVLSVYSFVTVRRMEIRSLRFLVGWLGSIAAILAFGTAAFLIGLRTWDATPLPTALLLLAAGLTIVVGGVGLTRSLAICRSLNRSERVVSVLADQFEGPKLADVGLTQREHEVLDVIATGRLSDREIAQKLVVSPATASTHVRNIMRKCDVRRRSDLFLLVGFLERNRYGGKRGVV